MTNITKTNPLDSNIYLYTHTYMHKHKHKHKHSKVFGANLCQNNQAMDDER
jgi:hypothetical protein